MEFSQSLFVIPTDMTSATTLKSCHCCGVVTVDVGEEVTVFVHLQVIGRIKSGLKWDSEFKYINCFLLLINNHYVRNLGSNTQVRRNGSLGRSGETRNIAVDGVGFPVEKIDDVVEDVVVPPCEPALVNIYYYYIYYYYYINCYVCFIIYIYHYLY